MRMTLQTRHLGADGPELSAIGLGCMSASWAYHLGERDDDESVRVFERALELGVTHLDTASMYGPEHNERLVGRAIRGGREGVTVASKAGLIVEDAMRRIVHRDGRPETLRRLCEGSLSRLGLETIDLYYLHRVDPDVPVEESFGGLSELVAEGKIRRLGISECTLDELGRAHAVHPVSALQSELSLWTRDPLENGTLDWCAEHGAAFVAFGVLGRGFLTGALPEGTTFPPNDFRCGNPRFTPEAMHANMRLVDGVARVAARRGATPAQVLIAWVLGLADHVLAIPGTKRRAYLEDDVGGDGLELDAADRAELERLPEPVGARYA